MILEYKCNNCNQYFKLKAFAKDRGELNLLKNKIVEKCAHCNTEQELILNNIRAKANSWIRFIYIVALVISIVISIIAYNLIEIENTKIHFRRYSFVFGLIFAIPFVIAVNLVALEKRAVKRFNHYYV
ncbi:MAG: hypothetical protein HRT67_08295 [Flavobacteriaceae bacterium]|nr:hypothetical protein [Flavobacteriaceae bacterium]